MFSLCDIHRDTDVLTGLLRGIVMSYATHESDRAVGTTNPKLDVVICPFADRILEFGSQRPFVFGKNRVVKTVEWDRTIAGIEALLSGVFVRRMKYLPCDQIASPTAGVR